MSKHNMIKILIVDDEDQLRTLLSRIISLEGYEVYQADSIKSGMRQIKDNKPDIVLCDVFLPDGNGVEAIPQFKSLLPDVEIIMLTAHGNIADGVRAIKFGAFDYLTKGDDNVRIVPMLETVSKKISLHKNYSFKSMIGNSKPFINAWKLAKKVAATDTTILLLGETGTGKEVFANSIHKASSRSEGPFVAVNCGALSESLLESEIFGYKSGAFTGAARDKKGLFEQADGGTIFLDEIGEMPINLQVKLLRVLETGDFIPVGDTMTKHVNARLIAATNKNLKESVAAGAFREDLYYRLSVFSIELPPLRDRGEDIIMLAKMFIDGFAAKMDHQINNIDDKFFDILTHYSWPGNIRELRNVIERSIIISDGDSLTSRDLPLELQLTDSSKKDWSDLATVEKAHICKILEYTNGNKTEAARLLKIGLTTLYRKIEEYGIII